MANQPLLSIGMIVKNEIRCLEKCLKALQPLRDAIPCELVIADTGSTDGTREVAEKYADILFDFEWINDFSAARNAVIKRCRGKWFMTVDADEYLVPEIDELVEFLTGPQADISSYATYIQRNHQTVDMNGVFTDFLATRMARMTPQLCYKGAIHEAFPIYDTDVVTMLGRTVLDHDGYAQLTPDHLQKKAQRDLMLLEIELEKTPDNYRCMLLCMEASSYLDEKGSIYAYRGMELIQKKKETGETWSILGAAIARQAVNYAVNKRLPEAEKWIQWSRETFPDSPYIQIDVNFLYVLFLNEKKRYLETWEIGQDYLRGLKRYNKVGSSAPENRFSSVRTTHPAQTAGLTLTLAKSCLEEKNKQRALDMLREVDLSALLPGDFPEWFAAVEKLADLPEIKKLLMSKILPIYENRGSGTEKDRELWGNVLEQIRRSFALEHENADTLCQLYADFPGTIGVCARLVNVETAVEEQMLLALAEDWDELMPLALQRAMELELVLPDAFYRIFPEKLHSLENDLAQHSKDAVQYTLQYTEQEQVTDWHRLCFAFDLLCAVCMQSNSFEGEYGDVLCDRFVQIGAQFLKEYYNPNVIASEDAIDRLPALHRFAWYVVHATELQKMGDDSGAVRTLRVALGQVEAMKSLVQQMLASFEKKQTQERIKTAPPELVALAQQVKAILSQYPADDPSVAALKQTPAYQQVAFLIEEPDGTAQ